MKLNGIVSKRLGISAARVLVAEFKRIRTKHGVLTAAVVVKAARSKSSPLHRFFIWDDSVAAERFRLDQAQRMIQNVRLEVSYGRGSKPQTVRALVRVVTPEGPSYEPIARVLSHKDLRGQLVADCLRDMRVFEAKYKIIGDLIASTLKSIARDRLELEKRTKRTAA